MKELSAKTISSSLKKFPETSFVIIDGVATSNLIKICEEIGVQVIVAKIFQTTDTKIKLLSL